MNWLTPSQTLTIALFAGYVAAVMFHNSKARKWASGAFWTVFFLVIGFA